MPFEEVRSCGQREEFCRLALAPGANVRELCRRFGISPATGYKWLERYRAEGRAGLADRSRRPLSSPCGRADDVEARVLAVRAEHPAWGGRKIRRVLRTGGLQPPPAASTITAILRRHGLLSGPAPASDAAVPALRARRAQRSVADGLQGPLRAGPGPLPSADGARRPLALSRWLIGACANEQGATVQPGWSAVFRRYGLPGASWPTTARRGGPPAAERHTPLDGLAARPGRAGRPRPALSPADPGQGRALPPHPEGRGARRPHASRISTRRQRAFDPWREVYNTTPPARGPRTWPGPRQPLRHEPAAPCPSHRAARVRARRHRAQGPARRLAQLPRATFYCPAPSPAAPSPCEPPTPMASSTSAIDHVLAQIDLRKQTKSVQDVPEHPFSMSPV